MIGSHAPQVHALLQTLCPQLSAGLHAVVEPGAQAPPPAQALHAPGAPHTHPAAMSHEVVRVRRPRSQLPQTLVSVRVSPGAHSFRSPPLHADHADQAPHPQVSAHVRVRVRVPLPQVPQEPVSVSTMPGVHEIGRAV